MRKIVLLQLSFSAGVSYVSNEVDNSSILNLLRKSFMPCNTLVHAIIMIVIIVSICKLYKRYMELDFLVSEGKLDFCDFVGQALVHQKQCPMILDMHSFKILAIGTILAVCWFLATDNRKNVVRATNLSDAYLRRKKWL